MLYEKFSRWYAANYRKLMLIPIVLFLLAVGIFWSNHARTGEFIPLNIDLSGGTVVTVYTSAVPEGARSSFELAGYDFREMKSYDTGDIVAVTVEAGASADRDELLALVNATFPGRERDVRTVGPALGQSFLEGALRAVGLSFLMMGVMMVFIFRERIVAASVILSSFFNVFETAAFMTLFGVKLAPHTIGALLMLMGWSVDSEVLFDTKLLKRAGGNPARKATEAMKTGMTMTISILASLGALHIVSTSALVEDIVLVLLLGAAFDLINTWFQSLSMVLWYVEARA